MIKRISGGSDRRHEVEIVEVVEASKMLLILIIKLFCVP